MWKQQLKVTLWKNLIIRKRHWCLTLCECLLPILLFVFIAFGRSKITALAKQEILDATQNDKQPISYSYNGFNVGSERLYYAPSNEYFDDIVHRVQVKFQIPNNDIKKFKTEKELLDEYANSKDDSVIALVFRSEPNAPILDYKVRYHKQSFNWKTQRLYEDVINFEPTKESQYLWQGFLAIQMALDTSFIEKTAKLLNRTVPDIELSIQTFPYPPYRSDTGLGAIFNNYLPLMTLFSFIFVCPAVIKRLVEEKYTGIKELMRMVGMQRWILWTGWFIYSYLPMMLSVFVIVFLLKVDIFQAGYPPIEYTEWSMLVMFLLLYCAAITVMCFFLSTWFHKPTLATSVGLLVWILSYFVPKYAVGEEVALSHCVQMFSMILPNMALHHGFVAIANYEVREIGVNWSNWHIPGGSGDNEVSLLDVCVMLVADCFIYFLFALYVDTIKPGKYGVGQSIYFPLKWLKNLFDQKDNGRVTPNSETDGLTNRERRELPKAIQLVSLTKRYGNQTVVNQVDLEIYRNQITVLLGHNGAGKSTIMGMLTGMIKKTSGQIYLNNKEVNGRRDATESIGLCPQHNLFFQDLTVAEHLKFFAMLKGRTCAEAQVEVSQLLHTLNLTDHANKLPSTLSGGMERKLCLGMAVIGGSQILVLDEPSSGLDPQSRRALWDLLLQWRSNRTILITTHFMEEADALGDWIAIMNEGRIQCYGTPMYLKKAFDTGTHLNLILNQDVQNVSEVIVRIRKAIKERFGKNIKLNRHHGAEVQFVISGINYSDLFTYLEAQKEQLLIENIAFSSTSLEDVFISSNHGNQKEETAELRKSFDGKSLDLLGRNVESSRDALVGLRLKGLLLKRFYFLKRNVPSYLIPFILSLAFLFLCIFLAKESTVYPNSGPQLELTLVKHGKTLVYFQGDAENLYRQTVEAQGSQVKVHRQIREAILDIGKDNFPFYRQHMVVAAELTVHQHRIDGVALYNAWSIHSAPVSLNLITNTLSQLLLGDQYGIHVANQPLKSVAQEGIKQMSDLHVGLLWLVVMPLGFLFFLGSFIYFPYSELSTDFTKLQLMCGISPKCYWIVTYLWDLMFYVVFAVLMSTFSLLWEPFRGWKEFETTFCIALFYGIVGIPYAYLFGRHKSFSSAYTFFVVSGMMSGVLFAILVSAGEESQNLDYIHFANIVKLVLYVISPQFSLSYTGMTFSRQVVKNFNFDHLDKSRKSDECHTSRPPACCDTNSDLCIAQSNYFGMLSPEIYLMLVGAVIYLMLNVFLDSYARRRGFKRWFCRNKYSPVVAQDGLVVANLTKAYSHNNVVNNIGFKLKPGSCMGLLGVNGAGKTTTFKMLTRQEIPDEGTIQIGNQPVQTDKYLDLLGYCPQNDALNNSLSGRNMLNTMAMLRGIAPTVEKMNQFLQDFGLLDIADRPCSQYSGGNKRKLSLAIAVLGFPEFILLDEPTNGVDPLSRRKFWNLIKNLRQMERSSIILTSHSMAECEALCNELQIMKCGKIERKGTISELKKHVKGFSVILKLRNQQFAPDGGDIPDGPSGQSEDVVDGIGLTSIDSQVDQLKTEIRMMYDNIKFRDQHSGLLHLYIEMENKRWNELFGNFEELKRHHQIIEDYAISEASLEDVFLEVAADGEKVEEEQQCVV